MPTEDTVLCPACGWSGPQSALDVTDTSAACPVCGEAIEYVD
jgi:predicted RNA-binding Zn-ribbon protein involved in translation (DUF1610 family)